MTAATSRCQGCGKPKDWVKRTAVHDKVLALCRSCWARWRSHQRRAHDDGLTEVVTTEEHPS